MNGRKASGSNGSGGTGNAAHRKIRWALLRTWRDYRESIRSGRPISLPNLLRLHQRRLWSAGIEASGVRGPSSVADGQPTLTDP